MLKGPSKARFELIFKEGRRVRGELCTVVGMPGNGLVGIGTSKKIGNRPRRNRAKRRFREAVRLQTQIVSREFDFLVIVGTAGTAASFSRIQDEVGALFGQAIARWEGG